jgi:hypothetical protein
MGVSLLAQDLACLPEKLPSLSYPPIAAQARVQGRVEANFTIDQAGRAQNVTMVHGHMMLQGLVRLYLVDAATFPPRCYGTSHYIRFEFVLKPPSATTGPDVTEFLPPDTYRISRTPYAYARF